MSWNVKNKTARRLVGYTLLELLLALSLTVVIVTMIATAIHTNGLTLTRVQASIERKQAARGILGMKQLQELGEAGVPSTSNNDTGASDGATGESEFEEEIAEPEVDGAPVFIGASNSVSIDISRLPRIDEYHPSIRSEQESSDTLADVKTVSYFVSQSNGPNERRGNNLSRASREQPVFSGGLYRRQIDRSVAVFEGFETTNEPDLFSELVAQEVVEISFRYFDGFNWFTEWDSEDKGGFPLAVEMYVLIDPARAGSIGTAGSGSSDRENLETYRAVVHLPSAEIVEQEEDDG